MKSQGYNYDLQGIIYIEMKKNFRERLEYSRVKFLFAERSLRNCLSRKVEG